MFKNFKYNETAGRTSFVINDVDISIINGIRRIILTNIPVVGFRASDVNIIKNTGPLHNEFMTHRIGLIPIHYSSDEIENFAEDTADEFELHVKNTSDVMVNVTTHDFRIAGKGEGEVHRLFPLHPISKTPVLITRLRAGEELHLKAKPVKSTASESASFAPVSLCTFQFIQDPKKIAEQNLGAEHILEKERAYFTDANGDPNNILFELEPETGLNPKYIVGKAIDILTDKIKMVITEVYNDPSEKITIKPLTSGFGKELVFNNEDDTLGNLLQSLLHNYFVRDADADTPINYVGYVCPHPLEPTMILHLRGQKEETDYIELLKTSCERIRSQLEHIRQSWSANAPEHIKIKS